MKNRCLVLAGLISILFTACSQEELVLPEQDVIEISAGILFPSQTRAEIAPDGKGSFVNGDVITLIASPQQAVSSYSFELTFQDGKWTPLLSWQELKADKAVFAAFYPVRANQAVSEFQHSAALDQRVSGAEESSDLLVARADAVRGVPVRLDFSHAMSRILLNLKSDGTYSESQLSSAVVSVMARNTLAVQASDASLGAVSGEPVKIIFQNKGKGAFQAIVCPQEVSAEWRNTCWLDIEIDGKHIQFKAPQTLADGGAFDRLESGRQLSLSLTLKAGDTPEIDWRNKTAWVYGLKNMPPLDQWGLYSNDPYQGQPHPVPGLTWKPEYGWYDCNKIDPTAPSFDDSNMCWAASCSNLIHWWLDQNAENVERYGKYDGPRKYPDSYGSEIFRFYKQHFTNEGYYIPIGLKWFFTGEYRNAGSDSAQQQMKHTGFFKDVFPTPEVTAASGYGLTETLKQVLLEKKAIALEILVHNNTRAHALTIWGAGFDEQGEVNVLYIAENNDRFQQDQVSGPMRPGKLCSAGLYAHKVQRQPDGSYKMESSTPGKFTITVNTLVFLGTNDADWDAYFQAHP